MPNIPTYRQLDRILKNLGYAIVRTKGSHVQYKKDLSLITVPKHANKEVSQIVFKAILNELGIDKKEFWKIYNQ